MMLHPKYPVVEGEYRMTEDWSVTLPERLNRRIEEGSLVLWRPGLTIWIIVWNNDHNEPKERRLAGLKESMSPEAFDLEEVGEGDVLRLAYRLNEDSDDKRVAAFYGFAVGEEGHVQIAIYLDDEKDLQTAKEIWHGLREHLPSKP